MAAEIRADLGPRRKEQLLDLADLLEISPQELLRRAVDTLLASHGYEVARAEKRGA